MDCLLQPAIFPVIRAWEPADLQLEKPDRVKDIPAESKPPLGKMCPRLIRMLGILPRQ